MGRDAASTPSLPLRLAKQHPAKDVGQVLMNSSLTPPHPFLLIPLAILFLTSLLIIT